MLPDQTAGLTDMSNATPREIDTRLEALYLSEAKAKQRLTMATDDLHRALGERKRHYTRRRYTWPTTHADALAAVRAKVADPGYREVPWGTSPTKALTAYDTAAKAVADVEAEQAPLHAEFTRRGGWSRFFVVQQHNGHIHSHMNCPTCNRGAEPTSFGWNPELSGLTEADAVAELGPALCTVCFPSAPVEWTVGTKSAGTAAPA